MKHKERIYSIVDIETTGGSITGERIIEVAVIQVQGGKEIGTFQTLLNPGKHLSPFISHLTGIKDADLVDAPYFEDIAPELFAILDGTIFVAHNARFDYGFIVQEFLRCGMRFQATSLCTVRLSRKLFPEYRRHGLDYIIDRCNIDIEDRHRAMGDALAVHEFMNQLPGLVGDELLEDAIKGLLKQSVVPPDLHERYIENLPEKPGVYLMYGKEGELLYVGKSVNIRKRVISHFLSSHKSAKEMHIFQRLHSIEFEVTAGELGALLREAELVKSLLPIYNQRLRRTKGLVALQQIVQDDGYHSVKMIPLDEIDHDTHSDVVGIFKTKKAVKENLIALAKEYTLCPKLLHVDSAKDACFAHMLGTCEGACIGHEKCEKYNAKFALAFESLRVKKWPYAGPVLVKETSSDANRTDIFVLDRWCIVAKGEEIDGAFSLSMYENKKFDYDMYKIIVQYFKQKSIRDNPLSISYEELEMYTSSSV